MGKLAIVLSAGGARGAYEAGVLYYVRKGLPPKTERKNFSIKVGTSVGAINTVAMAALAEDTDKQAEKIKEARFSIRQEDVYLRDFGATTHFLGSTVGAMLLTSPYAMWAFGQLSLVGLISNIFAVPLVPWAMALGTIILFFPFPPLVLVTEFFLDAILKTADLSAASPFGIWDKMFVSLLFMVGCYLALAIIWKWVIHKKVSKLGQMSAVSDKMTSLFFT